VKNSFNLIFVAFLFIGVLSLMSQQVNAKEVVVNIENIDIEKPGNIMVMLYGDKVSLKDHTKALAVKVMPALADKLTVTFSSVPMEFAIKVLHDENENGQVTKNWTGFIPAEGLGFSNGAKLSFGPPTFERAKVILDNTTSAITIKIIYP
jgi:uncharacterized protein (DUF2141 family)